MSAWVSLLSLDLAVVAIAASLLLVDALSPIAPGRWMGWSLAAALTFVLGASFFVATTGAAPHDAYVLSPWVMFHKRVFLIAAILAVLGTLDWLAQRTPRRQAEYYALLTFSLVGMMLLPGARDWLLLFVCFELMGIPLYVLAAYAKNDGPATEPKLAAEAGLKLFITGAASSTITLFGLALLIGATGTTRLTPFVTAGMAPIAAAGMLLVLAGFGFKVGAVPFHMWVPDTYEGAPTPFVAFLSVAPKAAGLSALALALLGSWTKAHAVWGPVLAVIALASMTIGNFFALPQTDVRRLLAFSGISQIGYALLALLARSEDGLAMALFFVATYVFTNLGVFLVVHVAAEASGGHTTSLLAGLSRRSPWLGGALLVFLLSLAGIPFVVGFWAKLFVFMAAYQAGLVGFVVAGVALSVVALFYYLSVARSTYMADGTQQAPIVVRPAQATAIVICLVAVLGLGLWPAPLVAEATAASKAFFVVAAQR